MLDKQAAELNDLQSQLADLPSTLTSVLSTFGVAKQSDFDEYAHQIKSPVDVEG